MRWRARSSALDGAAAAEAALAHQLALDVEHALEAVKACDVLGAGAGVEHAGEVDDGGDRGPDAAAEVFAVGADAQVVVAARSPRDGDDAQVAGGRLQPRPLVCREP